VRKWLSALILVWLTLLSLLTFAAEAQLYEPDTRIRGVADNIQYNVAIQSFSTTHTFTAIITVSINETLQKPEIFDQTDFVSVSYDYPNPPNCKIGDVVEVYGFWFPALDTPWSRKIRVDDQVAGSYVAVVSSPPSYSPPQDNDDAIQNEGSIDVQKEYSNGSIPLYSQYDHSVIANLWYDWVNTQGTQVVFFAYYTQVYNSPVITFVGQHYETMDGTQVFIGNTLALMEVFNDTNKNGIPDNSASLGNEIKYFFLVNSSVSFTVNPIEKILLQDIPHYRWGVKYGTIDGFLSPVEETSGQGVYVESAKVMIEHMSFSYDFYVQENKSYLKTNFEIGKIISIESPRNITLEGLSLSLLYTTATVTIKPYAVLVNGQIYNSTTAMPATTSTSGSEVQIENQKTFEFVFGQNYTRYRDSIAQSYQSSSVASATKSVSQNARVSLTWLFSQLREVLKDLFPKISVNLPTDINLDYAVSAFVYRVCYPAWDGYQIQHDPTYIAYINPKAKLPVSGPSPQLIIIAAIVGLIALTAALLEYKKTRKLLKTSVQFPLSKF